MRVKAKMYSRADEGISRKGKIFEPESEGRLMPHTSKSKNMST